MSKEHLTYFKVENFKRFDSLELTDIGQFNLVVGDNNVGKTSVLEALLMTVNTPVNRQPMIRAVFNLYQSLLHRGINVQQNLDVFLKYLSKNENAPIVFKAEYEEASWEMIFNKNAGHLDVCFKSINPPVQPETIQINIPNAPIEDTPLIPANIETNGKLYREYQDTIGLYRPTKHLIINNLKAIDSHIDDLEVLPLMNQSHVMVGFNNTDLYMPITGLGESAVRMFYYLLHIIQNRGQRLMIDEIDTGIHYSRMKAFLKNIIQLADKNEVQLFMTTHSLECQQAFSEVFDEEDMEQHQTKARQFTLIEKPDGQVVASKRNFEQLQHSLETGYDTRGGKRGW